MHLYPCVHVCVYVCMCICVFVLYVCLFILVHIHIHTDTREDTCVTCKRIISLYCPISLLHACMRVWKEIGRGGVTSFSSFFRVPTWEAMFWRG